MEVAEEGSTSGAAIGCALSTRELGPGAVDLARRLRFDSVPSR